MHKQTEYLNTPVLLSQHCVQCRKQSHKLQNSHSAFPLTSHPAFPNDNILLILHNLTYLHISYIWHSLIWAYTSYTILLNLTHGHSTLAKPGIQHWYDAINYIHISLVFICDFFVCVLWNYHTRSIQLVNSS